MKYFVYIFSFFLILSVGCTKKAKKKPDPNAVLTVVPATPKVLIGQSLKLEVNATDASYTVSSGEGSVAADGTFTAPATAQSVIVTVHGTPPKGKTAVETSVTIDIYEPLNASISTGTIYQFGGQAQISISGGAQPVTIQNSSGIGNIDDTSKMFVSPDQAGSTTLTVIDAANNSITFEVVVIPRVHVTSTERSAYINQAVQVTAADGKPPYSFTLISGNGSVDLTTGLYTASAIKGLDTIRVTDALGDTTEVPLQIMDPLTLTSVGTTVLTNDTLSFTAAGGAPPYIYAVAGVGSINSSGVFTSNQAGNTIVGITDLAGNTATVGVIVYDPLAITPTTKNILINATSQFSASGGVNPLNFSVVNVGGGTINSSNGLYQAPASPGVGLVRVTDALGNQADANVTVGIPMTIAPTAATLQTDSPIGFTATGGFSPYGFSVKNGGVGTILSNGTYSSNVAGNAIVVVTDVTGATATANLTIFTALTISPTTKNLPTNSSFKFTGSGGLPPFTYSKVSGGGSINATSGTYTAPSTGTTAVVRVNDSAGHTADATINVTPPLTLTAATGVTFTDTNVAFVASGGQSPYGFSLQGGSVGTILADGTFFSNVAGNATVTVTDNIGNTTSASIVVISPLLISPTAGSFLVNTTATFNASGGDTSHAYVFSVPTSGGGSVNASNGIYTSPANPITSATIRVTDYYGNKADAIVQVASVLAITPSSITIFPNTPSVFTGTGGFTPYTFNVQSGVGSILNDGTFNSPTVGTSLIRITDALGYTATANVLVVAPLAISPTTVNSYVNTLINFSATGGDTLNPYSYSIISGGGVINSISGAYTTAATATVGTIRVTDNFGLTSDATVNVADNVTLSPGPSLNALTNTNYTFTASGGYPSYAYSLQGGSVGMILGLNNFSSALPGSAVVITTDQNGHTASTNVMVYNPVVITAGTNTITTNSSTSLTATGGSGVYNYTITSGSGSVSQIGNNGTFSTSTGTGTTIIRATDSVTQFYGETTITVVPGVVIAPKTYKLTTLSPLIFSTSGGYPGYTYSIQSGNGSMSGNTYTAGPTSDVVVIKVTDSQNNVDTANITVAPPLSITQSSYNLAINSNYVIPVNYGFPPYTFTVVGVGSVSGGTFTSNTAGSATVNISDTTGAMVSSSITVYNPLTISPTTKNILTNGTTTFAATGGIAPLTFSVVNVGGGSINSSTGFYSAAPAPGTDVIRVSDSAGHEADATVTINYPISLSSSTTKVVTNGTAVFTANNGFPNPSYNYSIQGGGVGSIDATGKFVANVSGTSVIIASDSMSSTTATIAVYNPLSISPTTKNLTTSGTMQFSASGGWGAYNYSVIPSAGGSINASGLFTASTNTGTFTIHLIDSDSNFVDATVYIAGPLTLAPSTPFAVTNTAMTFNASGGFPAYSYAILSGPGTLSAPGNSYTSTTTGTVSVRVTDTDLTTATSSIVIYEPLLITTTATNTFVSTNINFAASGGDTSHNYSFSVVSGGGDGYFSNATTGAYVTSSTATTTTVKVTDFLGQTAQMSINIAAPFAVNYYPTLNAVTNTVYTFTATGGYPNYAYQVLSGVGNFAGGGNYSSATTGTASIKVSDQDNNAKIIAVNVYNPVVVTAGQNYLITGGSTSVISSGGAGSYSYIIDSGDGSLTQNGGNWTFTAPASAGTSIIKSTDMIGLTGTTTIVTVPPLALSPGSTTVQTFSVTSFSASGGVPNASAPYYTYNIVSGGGSIDSASGLFTAPATPDTVVIVATDSISSATVNITVVGPVAISPTSKTLAVNNSNTFNASGGSPPYTFIVSSGSGSITSSISSATYTAPASLPTYPGTAIVQVQDAFGSTAVATVTINGPITITPSGWTLLINESKGFSASGGTPPYSFSISAGTANGSINISTGTFTAGINANTSATVTVTDSLNNSTNATVNINDLLSLTPASSKIVANGTLTYTGSGGIAPYTYAVTSGSGSIDLNSGVFLATSTTEGTGAITITDSAVPAHTATTDFQIYMPLTITLGTYSVWANDTLPLTSTGGYGLVSWSMVSGTGNVVGNDFYAPAANETDVIRATDQLGNISQATLSVVMDIQISPTSATLSSNDSIIFTSTGGAPGTKTFSFSATSASIGSINPTTGSFLAPQATSGTVVIQVADSFSVVSQATIVLIQPVKLYSGGNHACVLFDNQRAKCWGDNSKGQLGLDKTNISIGTGSVDMGTNLPFITIGTNGETIKELSLGNLHTCALLSTNKVKCWGDNSSGQLGRGDTVSMVGNTTSGSLMIRNLPTVTVGSADPNIKHVFAGYRSTCAIIDDAQYTTKCWGLNNDTTTTAPYAAGLLGIDSTIVSIGTSAAQMSALASVTAGTHGLVPTEIYVGYGHTCMFGTINGGANYGVRCWGSDSTRNGANGMMFNSSNRIMGDTSGEIASVPVFIFGTGTYATTLSVGHSHSCVTTNTNTTRCWGLNGGGQLGNASTSNTNRSNDTNSKINSTTGNAVLTNVPDVTTGTFSVLETSSGHYHTCATVNTTPVEVHCWGENANGQLGINSVADATSLTTKVNLGTSSNIEKVAAGATHSCAMISDKTIKCWGLNSSGQLGRGDTTQIGSSGTAPNAITNAIRVKLTGQ